MVFIRVNYNIAFVKPRNSNVVNPNSWSGREFWVAGALSSNAPHVYHSDNGGYSFTALTEGYPTGVPANDLVYDRYTGVLYVATDVGVFYWDYSDNTWYRLGNNLPMKPVTNLVMNYCAGKLRAATFGRGIWEVGLMGNLRCYCSDTVYITETTNWYAHTHDCKNIVVKGNGVNFVINIDISFSQPATIVVRDSAYLIVNTGKTLDNANIRVENTGWLVNYGTLLLARDDKIDIRLGGRTIQSSWSKIIYK